MNKEALLAKRKTFFEAIFENINKPVLKIDQILNQAQYYIKPNKENTFYEVETGDFAICVKGSFFDTDFEVWYSLWQLGDILRVGVALNDHRIYGAVASDYHGEISHIWGANNEPRCDVAHGGVFYDWEFNVPELFESYKNQELYILGVRHMHFRIMRIVHDECRKLALEEGRLTVTDD